MSTEEFLRANFRINEETASLLRTYNTLIMNSVHNLVKDKLLELEKIDDLNETNNYSLSIIKYHIVDLESKLLEELN